MVKRKDERKKRMEDTKSGNKAIQPMSNKVYTKNEQCKGMNAYYHLYNFCKYPTHLSLEALEQRSNLFP